MNTQISSIARSTLSFLVALAALAAMAVASLTFTAQASAAAGSGSSAAETVDRLQAQGYTVQLNGIADAPLSQCVVTGIEGLRGATSFSTVYVDISCPTHN
ncbi:hypothetical protein [Mycobacteroides saopaulense]|uniref:PASTA domain-containing protein n=1 Tax=Mycobacteroides saopaulense TaxID=1578165 RepID=A0A1S1JN71_9MYCO|nr:hypothetical protein [Mycobacteroides saopaulense]ALR13600.1 hypothetical protein MYCSP_21715 [Mycobacteroides saopaulense]OHT85037.1 hypothetical protein BKG68_14490 [Mycobacteroides saopaulense]OHU11526.1 hypothetical protein BKG73_07530 [Mycobacteroides saopaulense]ORB49140.1 hypothetical protein BST43_23815 [Mycobacteroides saopaulense]